jgi:cold shock protein
VRGVRWTPEDPSVVLPSPTALAATWDPDLARRDGRWPPGGVERLSRWQWVQWRADGGWLQVRVVDVVTGRVLRFDDVRGFGFIARDSGDEDVFVHANDLTEDKSVFKAGTTVEFEIEEGDRGLKAVDVRRTGRGGGGGGGGRGPVSQFGTELTEALVTGVPELTGAQIVKIRQVVSDLARQRGVSL